MLFSGTLCGEADQVALEGDPCTGAAFATVAQDLQEVRHNPVVAAAVAAAVPLIERDQPLLFTEGE